MSQYTPYGSNKTIDTWQEDNRYNFYSESEWLDFNSMINDYLRAYADATSYRSVTMRDKTYFTQEVKAPKIRIDSYDSEDGSDHGKMVYIGLRDFCMYFNLSGNDIVGVRFETMKLSEYLLPEECIVIDTRDLSDPAIKN